MGKLTSIAFLSRSVNCSPALGKSVFAKLDSNCFTSSSLTAVIAVFQRSPSASHRAFREFWMSALVRVPAEKLRDEREASSSVLNEAKGLKGDENSLWPVRSSVRENVVLHSIQISFGKVADGVALGGEEEGRVNCDFERRRRRRDETNSD